MKINPDYSRVRIVMQLCFSTVGFPPKNEQCLNDEWRCRENAVIVVQGVNVVKRDVHATLVLQKAGRLFSCTQLMPLFRMDR